MNVMILNISSVRALPILCWIRANVVYCKCWWWKCVDKLVVSLLSVSIYTINQLSAFGSQLKLSVRWDSLHAMHSLSDSFSFRCIVVKWANDNDMSWLLWCDNQLLNSFNWCLRCNFVNLCAEWLMLYTVLLIWLRRLPDITPVAVLKLMVVHWKFIDMSFQLISHSEVCHISVLYFFHPLCSM
jgi:hypothetical protein